MEAGFVALLVFMTAVGIAVGMLIERHKTDRTETQGTIYVYCASLEEQPSLLLDYNVPIDDIASRKQVLFDVDVIQ